MSEFSFAGTQYAKGTRCTIAGLQGASQHNGKGCTILAFDEERGRYKVRMDVEGLKLSVKPANVQREERTAAAEALEKAKTAVESASEGGEQLLTEIREMFQNRWKRAPTADEEAELLGKMREANEAAAEDDEEGEDAMLDEFLTMMAKGSGEKFEPGYNMENHPLFCKDEAALEAAALADPDGPAAQMHDLMTRETTAIEEAQDCKHEGNENLRRGRFFVGLAIKHYTNGLAEKLDPELPEERELLVQLYCNRCQAHLRRRNKRKALLDSAAALELDPKNVKAHFRGARAANMLMLYSEAIRRAQSGLAVAPHNAQLAAELKTAKKGLKGEMAQARVERKEHKVETARQQTIAEALGMRGLTVGNEGLECQALEYETAQPVLGEDGMMRWPVLFVYEQYRTRDLVTGVDESSTLAELLSTMFPHSSDGSGPTPPKWDARASYRSDLLDVYAVTEWAGYWRTEKDGTRKWSTSWDDGAVSIGKKYVKVKQTVPLLQVLLELELKGGVTCPVPRFPVFCVFSRNESEFQKKYLASKV